MYSKLLKDEGKLLYPLKYITYVTSVITLW